MTYLYWGSLKKYSEVKLTSLPLSLATSDTDKWSEMPEDVEDTMPSTCQVNRNTKTSNAHACFNLYLLGFFC